MQGQGHKLEHKLLLKKMPDLSPDALKFFNREVTLERTQQ